MNDQTGSAQRDWDPRALVREALARVDRGDLSPTDRLVLTCLALHANREGKARPGNDTIAEFAGCERRSAKRSIPRLKAQV
jgi:Helix-turn-helix domain